MGSIADGLYLDDDGQPKKAPGYKTLDDKGRVVDADIDPLFDAVFGQSAVFKSLSGFYRWKDRTVGVNYLVFDKKTKDFEECTTQQDVERCLSAWMEQGCDMDDVVVYAVDSRYRPTMGWKMKEIEDDTDDALDGRR